MRIFKGAADQSTLSAEERRNNMRRSVELYAPAPKSPVMVIDDVMTTGSTLSATVEVLRGAGAKIAGGLVFADV
ncbi:ComF family protein [Corynebacterium sp. J010B-136]|uniref:ComF family protein n=1 Tax=Corynebacterium sp. J010B-136 TaxID=2099401 RepID=UPI001E562367|nr:phosphoribosyltransferase family protein [Corynebacterium sp. J010B-136]